MLASDIPGGYPSGYKMAKSLATYVDDPKEVRRRVLEIFDQAPCLETIKTLRAKHLHVHDYGDFIDMRDYSPAKDIEKVNRRFVLAQREVGRWR